MLAKWFLGSGTRRSGMACVSISWSETQMVLFSRRLTLASEKEMAAYSSVLAWRIPGTGEPGGLLSVGLHRVRQD